MIDYAAGWEKQLEPVTTGVIIREKYRLTRWCIEMAAFVKGIGEQLRGREMAGRISESTMRRVDWLAVAIGNLGGPNRAAKRLGLSPQTVYTWITKGLRGVDFAKVYNLSKEGDVPLEYLARRLGPWDGPMELPKLNDEGADFDDEA